MEPQGLGCGVNNRGSSHVEKRICFNGATGFRLWSPDVDTGSSRVDTASMEPQGLGCGVVESMTTLL